MLSLDIYFFINTSNGLFLIQYICIIYYLEVTSFSPLQAAGSWWRSSSAPFPPGGLGAQPASQSPPSEGTCHSHPAWHCSAVAAVLLDLRRREREIPWEAVKQCVDKQPTKRKWHYSSKFGVSTILFSKDTLNWSKVIVNTFLLPKIKPVLLNFLFIIKSWKKNIMISIKH